MESGGDTLLIPVTVTPIEVASTFSTLAPAENQPVTVTAPAGYKFMPGAFITFGTDTAVVLSRTPDSTSFTFVPVPVPAPGAASFRTGAIDSVEAAYITGIPLRLPTADSILVPFLDTVPGTDAPSAAPTIATPAPGEVSAFFDVGTFTGADVTSFDGGFSLGAQYYKFTLAEAASINITLNWSNIGPDLDLILCFDAACSTEDDVAAGASKPESGDYNLPAGTYYIAAPFFAGTIPPAPPDFPTRISIIITRAS